MTTPARSQESDKKGAVADIKTYLLEGSLLVPYICLWLFAEELHSVNASSGGVGKNLKFLRRGVELFPAELSRIPGYYSNEAF